jgi:hypothetical protein|tara:strand:- start:424 stop:1410 length:987 start_codon:yes stop_codon:yes gene_type:complete
MKLNNKYIIGCHVMFYEIDMVEEYLNSVYLALEEVENKENVKVEMMWNMSEYFEEFEDKAKVKITHKIEQLKQKYRFSSKYYVNHDRPYTMADYRRELNNQCNECDYVIWGESDCLMPRQMFGVLEQLKEYANQQGIHRYITTFGIRKMWDESWRVLEHPEFTNKPYYDMDTEEDKRKAESSPWSIRYTMSQDEMDEVNSKTEDLDVQVIGYPKFDGSGLVISSDLLRTGANIPPAVYMNGDDSSFLESCRLHMGEQYKQFVVKNILKVHNRNHPKKRHYVKGEDQSKNTHFKRATKNWYKEFNNVSKGNLNKLYYSQEPFNKKDFKK